MGKCACGGRAKKGAPALSVIQLSDVALPIFNFGNNPFSFPPSPPGFSALWASDTAVLCGRDPESLYLEFAPYKANVLTAALKKLWRKNCECKPERGTWNHTYEFETYYVDQNFPNGRRQNFSVVGGMIGPYVNMRLEIVPGNMKVDAKWYGYSSTDNYQSEKLLVTRGIAGVPSPTITSTFSQVKISDGCYGGSEQPPTPPQGVANPWLSSPTYATPPPSAYIPELPKTKRPILPTPDECC